MITTVLSLVLMACVDAPAPAPDFRHPHFPKKLEVSIPASAGREPLRLVVSYQTATFDAKGFEEMPEGRGWHLANAHLEVSAAVRIGGREVAPGTYRLLARKAKEGRWELVLDDDARFSARFTDHAKALATEFAGDAPRQEHLHIDIHPSGVKDRAAVQLVVHFDRYLARARIDLP